MCWTFIAISSYLNILCKNIVCEFGLNKMLKFILWNFHYAILTKWKFGLPLYIFHVPPVGNRCFKPLFYILTNFQSNVITISQRHVTLNDIISHIRLLWGHFRVARSKAMSLIVEQSKFTEVCWKKRIFWQTTLSVWFNCDWLLMKAT